MDVDPVQNHEAVTALHHTLNAFHTPSASEKYVADTALRASFEDWLTIPVCHFFYMPMSAYMHLTSTTVILLRRARLVLLTRHRQSGSYAPQTHLSPGSSSSDDLMLDLLDRLASRFEDARIEMAAAHCSEWANDLLDLLSWKLRERKSCLEKWTNVLSNEANAITPSGVETAETHRPGGLGGDGNDFIGSETMNEPAIAWLDPLEALLSGSNSYGNWF